MDSIKRKLAAVPVKRWLWLIIGLGVVARFGAGLVMGDRVEVLPGIYDQVSYHTLAVRLLDGHGFTFETEWWPVTQAGEPTAHWSYLYTFYLVAIYALVGVHPLVARLVQALVIGVVMPLLAYWLGRHLSPGPSPLGKGGEQLKSLQRGDGAWVGLVAAAWVAWYPYFIYYSAALMTEMFYITAIMGSLVIAVSIAHSHTRKKGWWGGFAAMGVVIGCAVLLRQVYLAFVPFLLGWVALRDLFPDPSPAGKGVKTTTGSSTTGKERRLTLSPSTDEEVGKLTLSQATDEEAESLTPIPSRRSMLRFFPGVMLSLLVLVLMILPFTLWNYHQFGRFVLLNTNAGYAFFWANHPIHGDDFVPLFTPDMPTYQELIPDDLRTLDEAALDKALMQRGLGFVLADPWRYVRLSLSRIDDHFIFWPRSDSSLLSNITRVTSIGLALPFMIFGTGRWLVEAWQRTAGRLLSRLWGVLAQPGGLLLLFFLVYVGVHLLSWAGIRYRLPADAVMLVFAAYSFYSFPRRNE